MFRPWAVLPYFRPCGSSICGFSVCIAVPGSHVPLNRLLCKLRPPLYRMPLRPSTGSVGADPAVTTPCGFDIVPTLSILHQWFPFGPLLASHLTWFFPGLFLLCSRPCLLFIAAEGGLEPAPVSRFRGASPHQLRSCALLGPFDPWCSWHTVIGVPHHFRAVSGHLPVQSVEIDV